MRIGMPTLTEYPKIHEQIQICHGAKKQEPYPAQIYNYVKLPQLLKIIHQPIRIKDAVVILPYRRIAYFCELCPLKDVQISYKISVSQY